MPVRQREELPPAKTLKELVGAVITITPEPLKEVTTDFGKSFLGTMSTGDKVWLSQTVVNSFDGGHQGTYRVYAYQAHGKQCFGLDNAE